MADRPHDGRRHALVVIGLSAGGIRPLEQILAVLPTDLAASVLVVMHLHSEYPSSLVDILSRRTELAVLQATDGRALVPGEIYVAPPDRHLLVADGEMKVTWSARENGFRPSIDLLFRSAARSSHPVIAVLLSGALSDGTDGLWAVKASGGATVVQDPSDAAIPSMVKSALHALTPDAVLPGADIGEWVVKKMSEQAERVPAKVEIEEERISPTGYTCPDCGGVLWVTDSQSPDQLRCRVGHGWTTNGLSELAQRRIEDSIWTALRIIEEQIALDRRLLARAQQAANMSGAVARFRARIERREAAAAHLREVLAVRPSSLGVPPA